MDKMYSFDWLISDIDASIIFMLRDGKEMLGSYSVSELKTNGLEEANIKFANINDLTNFINYTTVRFAESQNNSNIIEIPLSSLYILYQNTNEITSDKVKAITLPDLEAFGVHNEQILRNGYAIYAYKINEESEELKEVMRLTNKFASLNMNDKINALEEINLINYQRQEKNRTR